MSANAAVMLAQWSYQPRVRTATRVHPDGCRDVIVVTAADGRRDWFVSDLDNTTRTVVVNGLERYEGIRLRPGASIDTVILAAELAQADMGRASVVTVVEASCSIDVNIREAIAGLSSRTLSITAHAREQGLGARQLQRLFASQGLPPPLFWMALARARRTVAALPQADSLASLALDMGYSDQAHMGREFRRWFGTTPARLRRDKPRLEELLASGLATGS